MDQVKIGKFIAERRRARGATQEQLAEMLNITDRAVSKWERGISLPDVSIMPELCDILGITVNDLLSGEIVTTDKRGEELENNLIELLIEKKVSDRGLLATEWIVAILSIIILFVPVFVAAFAEVEEWLRLIIAFSGFIPAFIGICFAVRIEQIAGYYECRHCGNRYVPSYRSVNLAAHIGRTRYMKCPRCEKKSWQKKVIGKNNNSF